MIVRSRLAGDQPKKRNPTGFLKFMAIAVSCAVSPVFQKQTADAIGAMGFEQTTDD